jgi:hypothetical protein
MKHEVAAKWYWDPMIQTNSNLPTATENWEVKSNDWRTQTVLQEIADLKREMRTQTVLQEIADLKREIKKLKSESRHVGVLKVRECDYLKAKDEILALVQKHRDGVSTIEIAEELCLEPEIVLKALSELIDDGKIGKNNTRN